MLSEQTWPVSQKAFASKTEGKWLPQKRQALLGTPSFLPSFFVRCCLRCLGLELKAQVLQQGCDGCSYLAPEGSQRSLCWRSLPRAWISRSRSPAPLSPSCRRKEKPPSSPAPSSDRSSPPLFWQRFRLRFQAVGLAAVSQARFVSLPYSGRLRNGGGQGELGS